MKKQQFQEVKNESIEKLVARVAELKLKIVKAQMPSLGETPTNVKIAHNLRREVAQLMTLISQKKKEVTK